MKRATADARRHPVNRVLHSIRNITRQLVGVIVRGTRDELGPLEQDRHPARPDRAAPMHHRRIRKIRPDTNPVAGRVRPDAVRKRTRPAWGERAGCDSDLVGGTFLRAAHLLVEFRVECPESFP
jgi:hypothetical protein